MYPVIEHPHKRGSLKGKPNHPGYQSHYIKVNKKGVPVLNGSEIYDELVVFQESQVLPRYVVYASPGKQEEENIQVIAQPTEVNRDTLQQIISRTKELLGDLSFSAHLGYFDKRTITQCLKEVETWQDLNPDKVEVMVPYKKLIKVIPILNATSKKIFDEKKKEEEEKAKQNDEDQEESVDVEEEEITSNQDISTPIDDECYDSMFQDGDSQLMAELLRLREMNKRLMSENAYLHKKVQWLEVLAVNNGGIKRKRTSHKQNSTKQ